MPICGLRFRTSGAGRVSSALGLDRGAYWICGFLR